jgi:hypothetical protein
MTRKELVSNERCGRAVCSLRKAVAAGREFPDAEWDISQSYQLSDFEVRRVRAWYDDGWTPPTLTQDVFDRAK